MRAIYENYFQTRHLIGQEAFSLCGYRSISGLDCLITVYLINVKKQLNGKWPVLGTDDTISHIEYDAHMEQGKSLSFKSIETICA